MASTIRLHPPRILNTHKFHIHCLLCVCVCVIILNTFFSCVAKPKFLRSCRHAHSSLCSICHRFGCPHDDRNRHRLHRASRLRLEALAAVPDGRQPALRRTLGDRRGRTTLCCGPCTVHLPTAIRLLPLPHIVPPSSLPSCKLHAKLLPKFARFVLHGPPKNARLGHLKVVARPVINGISH